MDLPVTSLEIAVEIIKSGGVVVFPTETAYGLAADATNTRAVEKIITIKGREEGKSFPLIAADRKMVETHVILSPQLSRLADKFWPGPLTIVAQIRSDSNLSPLVVQDGTAAIRVSSHPLAHNLAKKLGGPIVSTSANLSGQPTCYDLACVKKQFIKKKLQPDLYLDDGVLERRPPSTIVEEEAGQLVILRHGDISPEEILRPDSIVGVQDDTK